MNRFFKCTKYITSLNKELSDGDILCISRYYGVMKCATTQRKFDTRCTWNLNKENKMIELLIDGYIIPLSDRELYRLIPHLTLEQRMFDLNNNSVHLSNYKKQTPKKRTI